MVVIVTYDGISEPHPHDRPLWEALARHRVDAKLVSWSNPAFDWHTPKLCVLRTPWDYFKRRDEFLAWARTVPRLWNSAEVVEWNSHKRYLAELEARGIPVVATEALPAGSHANLAEVAARRGWSDVVVKPAVSAGAWRTFIARAGTLAQRQAELEVHLAEQEMLVQPFIKDLGEQGERSLIYIAGELTHCIARSPGIEAPGAPPLRLERSEPTGEERTLAERALVASGLDPEYVRVDLARDNEGRLVVMELEMIEPNLFFHLAPDAADTFAAHIAKGDRLLFLWKSSLSPFSRDHRPLTAAVSSGQCSRSSSSSRSAPPTRLRSTPSKGRRSCGRLDRIFAL